jgi:hypothetical protein
MEAGADDNLHYDFRPVLAKKPVIMVVISRPLPIPLLPRLAIGGSPRRGGRAEMMINALQGESYVPKNSRIFANLQ